MKSIVFGAQTKYGFFSGLHGDETGVIESVYKALEKYKDQLGSYIYIPECSPTAVSLKTRLNGEGIDLNRAFSQHPTSDEAQSIIETVKPYIFELCVDFHEDVEHPGVYLYDYENIEGSPKLAEFRRRVALICPLHNGVDDEFEELLGGTSIEGYHASSLPIHEVTGDVIYEGFMDQWLMHEGHTKRWMTLEVPSNLTPEQKNEIVDIFFRTLILG